MTTSTEALTPFFDNLIDDFSIWQHTDGQKVIEKEGYALDDAARGLIVCLALDKIREAEVLFRYIKNSQIKNGFYGFATKDRQYIAYPASEDATGQVIWAMGYASSIGFHEPEARELTNKVSSRINDFQFVRGYAYALLGALYIDETMSKTLANKLINFFKSASDQWYWPETEITYGNGIIPYALVRYATILKDKEAANIGLKALNFLDNKCRKDRLLGPIGNEGWLKKQNKKIPTFSQQPIDSAYMIWAWLAAYTYHKNEEFLNRAEEWMDWFNGYNILEVPMYNSKTLKAYDGIDEEGINYHSGAEANITLLLSLQMLKNKITL